MEHVSSGDESSDDEQEMLRWHLVRLVAAAGLR